MELEKLEVYNISMDLSDNVWKIVSSWQYFEKDTIGKQLVRSADSVSANISEGFGRFHYKDAKLFLYYARGSLFETKTWLSKASQRELVKTEEFEALENQIKILGIKLNKYIKSIGQNVINDYSK
jgi:four helix bundle protein